MNAHTAVVLAAGASTRLGRPKQLLLRDGETLLRRAVRLVASTSPRTLVVVLGFDPERFVAELAGLPCTVAINAAWADGMSTSLRAAAPLIDATMPTLVIGCDQPALELAHATRLLEGARRAPGGIAATRHAGKRGIPAVIPGAWFASMTGLGDIGFGPALRALDANTVFELDAPELTLDIDTDADVARARALRLIDAHRS